MSVIMLPPTNRSEAMSDKPWIPCALCRTHRRVQYDHWQSFPSEAELEAHLKEHLSIAQKERDEITSILQQWRFQETWRRWSRQTSRDPNKSVLELFQSAKGAKDA